MTEIQYAVILVNSTNYAIKAERFLQAIPIACKLIPVPRQLSSDCGVCVRVQQADRERVLQVLEAAGAEIEGVYDI